MHTHILTSRKSENGRPKSRLYRASDGLQLAYQDGNFVQYGEDSAQRAKRVFVNGKCAGDFIEFLASVDLRDVPKAFGLKEKLEVFENEGIVPSGAKIDFQELKSEEDQGA